MTKIDTIETLTDFFDKLDLFEKYTVKELLEHFVCIDGVVYEKGDLHQCKGCDAYAPVQVDMGRFDHCQECEHENAL